MGYGDGHSGGKLPRILGAILDRLHSPSKKHSEDRQEQYAPRLSYGEYHKSNQRQVLLYKYILNTKKFFAFNALLHIVI